MTFAALSNKEVSAEEDVRRAIHPTQLDELGEPTSAAFKTAQMSLDVASLATLESTRQRFPRKHIAIISCAEFRALGYPPVHDPLPDNPSHAIVREKLSASAARKIAAAIKSLIGPDDPSA